MESVLSRSAPCPRHIVTDHGSRRGVASKTVSRGGRPAQMLPSSAKSCHRSSARSPSRNETIAGWA